MHLAERFERGALAARPALDVAMAQSGEPRTVPFNDLVTETLERYVEDRRALIISQRLS